MRNVLKILLFVAIASFLFVIIPAGSALAGECKTYIQFDAQPRLVPENGTLNLAGYVSMKGSVWEPPGPNSGFCMAGTTVVKSVEVQFLLPDGYGGFLLLSPSQSIKLEPARTTAYNFSATFKPVTQKLKAGSSFAVTVKVFTANFKQLTASTPVSVTVVVPVFETWACVADDGKYACSPTNDPKCSDVPACQSKDCGKLDDATKCRLSASSEDTHLECVDKTCRTVLGTGANTCTTDPDSCAGGTKTDGNKGGSSRSQEFVLKNPIGIDTFQDLVNIIGRWIFNLAIPIAVIIIIYAGTLMLTAGGNPKQFTKGTEALKYAVIGLSVVLIGRGFVTLIQSILSLRGG